MTREKGTCPQCGEEDLVHNIGTLFECNSCEFKWDESLPENKIKESVEEYVKAFSN